MPRPKGSKNKNSAPEVPAIDLNAPFKKDRETLRFILSQQGILEQRKKEYETSLEEVNKEIAFIDGKLSKFNLKFEA